MGTLRKKVVTAIDRSYLFAIHLGWPRISALLLGLITKVIDGGGQKRVLCLGRTIFIDDIHSLAKYSGKYTYLVFNKNYLGMIVRSFIPYSDLAEDNYHTDQRFKPGIEKIDRFVSSMLPVLHKVLRFDAVMTCNFGYIDQQEFLRVAREMGIPVIVLYKEGLANPRIISRVMAHYPRLKSWCDLCLCYSENTRNALIGSGLPGLTAKQVQVTGIPRVDYYLNEVTSTSADKVGELVLFSFIPKEKFIAKKIDSVTFEEIENRSKRFHEMAIRYAIENPTKRVIIKTKFAQHYVEYVREIITCFLNTTTLPCNLKVTNMLDPRQLIADANCVFGSNSTTLLEGLLVAKPVSCPDFRDLIDLSDWDLFSGYESLLFYLSTYDSFVDFVETDHQLTTAQLVLREQLYQRYAHCPDGEASQRVEGMVDELMKRSIGGDGGNAVVLSDSE